MQAVWERRQGRSIPFVELLASLNAIANARLEFEATARSKSQIPMVRPEYPVTRWYHCVTRCVRARFCSAKARDDRKLWIERRLQELADIFAVAVGGFSVMDNHLHVLVRLDPDVAKGWSDEQVVRRWGALFPPRDKSRQALPVSESWVQWRLKDEPWVAMARTRLQSLSWFMKCLKEPLGWFR